MSAVDGGPAFPQPNHFSLDHATGAATSHESSASGVTVRDFFAAKALAGSLFAGHDMEMRGHEGWRDEIAREAFRYADAMLRAREATP